MQGGTAEDWKNKKDDLLIDYQDFKDRKSVV